MTGPYRTPDPLQEALYKNAELNKEVNELKKQISEKTLSTSFSYVLDLPIDSHVLRKEITSFLKNSKNRTLWKECLIATAAAEGSTYERLGKAYKLYLTLIESGCA